MKNNLIALCILLCLALQSFSKEPPNGYLGKRMLIGYKLKLSHPRVYFHNLNYPDINNHFFVEYALKDKNAIEAGLSYGYLSYNRPTYIKSSDVYGAHNISLDVAYKAYVITGHYAPMGFYVGYGMIFNTLIFNTNSSSISNASNMYKINLIMVPGFKYTMGRNYIIGNNLVLNVGLDLNLSPVAFFMAVTENYNEKRITHSYMLARQEAYKRLGSANGLQLNFGIGYLK